MSLRLRTYVVAFAVILSAVPYLAHAYPIGGQARIVLPCIHNSTIYARLGPPRGGAYVWTVKTKTYESGPPRHAGQWVLGLASVPYFCFYSLSPVKTYPATIITMMGSSK